MVVTLINITKGKQMKGPVKKKPAAKTGSKPTIAKVTKVPKHSTTPDRGTKKQLGV